MAGRTTKMLGLLGTDPRIAEVAAAARGRGWDIVAASDSIEDAAGRPSWTALLDEEFCDAVLVGADGWTAARAEAVRTLVQAGRTMLLAQPLEPSMLWAFELDMIARDSGARLLPCLPDRLHPCIAALRTAVDAAAGGAGPLGALESIRLERSLTDRSREAVLAALARDADIVRVLVGDPARVATLGAGDPDAAWPTLAVGLTGPAQAPTRWQVSAADPHGLRITLHHTRGALDVFVPDGPDPWIASPPLPQSVSFDRGAVMLDVVAGVRGTRPPVPAATWHDAARALEIAETVPRSIAKGRAIDLHQEEFSEIGTFKGTMASLGCGIVLVALFVMVIATLVAGISRELDWSPGKAIANAWPLIVLAVLVGFLTLQLLPLLLGPDRPQPGGPDRES